MGNQLILCKLKTLHLNNWIFDDDMDKKLRNYFRSKTRDGREAENSLKFSNSRGSFAWSKFCR